MRVYWVESVFPLDVLALDQPAPFDNLQKVIVKSSLYREFGHHAKVDVDTTLKFIPKP